MQRSPLQRHFRALDRTGNSSCNDIVPETMTGVYVVAGTRLSTNISSGAILAGGGTGTIVVNSLLVPRTSLPNLRLWETSTLTEALKQPKPTFAEALTLMFVSVDVVVLMSMVTSIVASENW